MVGLRNSSSGEQGGDVSAPVRLARNIATDIIRNGIPVGAHLGSLPDVAKHYSISVPTLRKAIAFLQDDGIVVPRGGRGGGLVVGSPPMDSALQAMRRFFSDIGVTLDQVWEARDLIDTALAERACRFVDRPFLNEVERIFSTSRDGADLPEAIRAFDRVILGAARQPVFALIAQVLDLLESELDEKTPFDFACEWDARYNCSRAIVAGNLADAIRFKRMLRPLPASIVADKRSKRLGDKVAGLIKELIRERDLAPGDFLGRESEFQVLFGVGYITLRDALRPLERSGTVRLMQGRKGGVYVGSAEPYDAIAMISLYLSSIKLTFAAQADSRKTLEPRAAWLAAQRMDGQLSEQLSQAVAAEMIAAASGSSDWHEKSLKVERLIAHAAGNPLIELFTLIHIEFSRIQAGEQKAAIMVIQNDLMHLSSRHHQRIAREIVGGFPAKAAFAAREFLNELGERVEKAVGRIDF